MVGEDCSLDSIVDRVTIADELSRDEAELCLLSRTRLASEQIDREAMSSGKVRALLLLLCVCRSAADSEINETILVRPLNVYEGLIKGVHDYYNNTCIILFHGSSMSIETSKLEEIEGLLALQRYFSGDLKVRTAIMNFETFRNRVGRSYYHIKRPLFVLLNDLGEMREQFILVSKWIAMAYPTWLVFLRDDTRIEDFLLEVYVPFDCLLIMAKRNTIESGEILTDVYRISQEDDLRSMKFGSWDAINGFKGPGLSLYQRRHDLHGKTIRVVSVNNPPVSVIIRDEANRTIGIGGFFGEIISLLQKSMNCTFTYASAESWGQKQPNGSWSGSLRMLIEDEADLIAAEIMMTPDRLDVVKFSSPMYSSRQRVYIKRPDTAAVKWSAYLAPFALNIWNAVALTILIAGLMIAAINALARKSNSLPVDSRSSSLSEIMFFVFGAFCNQGMEPSPLDPIRIVHLNIHITAVVVLAAYSAALISFLAVKTFAMPFTTMKGMLEDGTYRFAVLSGSGDGSIFENTTDPVIAFMFEKLLPRETDLPVNDIDGLRRICKEYKYGFMTQENIVTLLQGLVDCYLEPLDSIIQITISMAMSAQSPYSGLIDSNILLLRDSGILQRLLAAEWIPKMKKSATTWTSVELEDAMPLFIFLLLAYLVAYLVLLFERLFHERLDCGSLPRRKFRPNRWTRFSKKDLKLCGSSK